ncbi:MAG: oligosaccharide flippase family protein, partial [Pseudomonadota bacterium]
PTALRLHAGTATQLIGTQIDRLVLLTLMTPREIGLYFVALSVASLAPGLVTMSVKTVVLPKLAAGTEGSQGEKIARLVRLTVLFSVLLNAGVIGVAPLLIPLLFGDAFAEAVPLAMLLAMATVLQPARDALLEGLKALERPQSIVTTHLIGIGVFGGAAAAFLLPSGADLGLMAIPLALAASVVASTLYAAFETRRAEPSVPSFRALIPGPRTVRELIHVAVSLLPRRG